MSALPDTALSLTWTCRLLPLSSETSGRSYHEPSASTAPAKVLLFIKKTLLPSKKLSPMKLRTLSQPHRCFLVCISWDVELYLRAEHKNGLPVPGTVEYYMPEAGKGLGARNSWWVPLPL